MAASPTPRFPAHKQPGTARLIHHTLILPAVRRTFRRVALLDQTGDAGAGLPTILYANHVSWWDGYMAVVLERHWRGEFYLMMEEAQLRRYRFFQLCGCFSVDRQDAREALRSVHYAADLLRNNPQRSVWIFPQGQIAPNDRRPLVTYPGTAHMVKRLGQARCIPVALRFEFLGEQRPEAFIRLGQAHIAEGNDVRTLQADFDRRLVAEVEALRSDVVDGDPSHYTTILGGRQSINVVWDRVRGK